MVLVFYAQVAPSWWPWQAVSLSNERIPRLEGEAAKKPLFFVDNGAFAAKSWGLEAWTARLLSFSWRILRRYPRAGLLVVLPDRIDAGLWTLKAAKSGAARRLCTSDDRIRCAAVAHAIPGDVDGRRGVAEELAALDYVHVLAAPLKANCRSRATGLPGRRCQLEVARTVCGAAAAHGLPCHLLAPRLDATLAQLSRLPGVESFDSAAWIRPRRGGSGFSPAYGFGRRGAEQRFLEKLARLLAHGVPLRLPPSLPAWLRSTAILERVGTEDEG